MSVLPMLSSLGLTISRSQLSTPNLDIQSLLVLPRFVIRAQQMSIYDNIALQVSLSLHPNLLPPCIWNVTKTPQQDDLVRHLSKHITCYFIGLFAAHSGVNCSHLESEGFQQLTSTLAVIQTLREVNYIPGITIGQSNSILYIVCHQF